MVGMEVSFDKVKKKRAHTFLDGHQWIERRKAEASYTAGEIVSIDLWSMAS